MKAHEELAAVLEEIAAGHAKPVYLLHGDEYLCRTAALEISHALVPEKSRDLNLALFDSAAGPSRVAEELRTVPMFRGVKAVLVQPAEFLAPRKSARGGDPWAKVRDLWATGKRREAARRTLALAGRAGFPLEGLDRRGADDWRRAGLPMGPGDGEILAGTVEMAAAEGLGIPESDTRALEELIEKGLPSGHHLVAVAEELDAGAPLVKLMKAKGVEIARGLPAAAGPGWKKEADAGELSAEVLGPMGKRIHPDAARLLVARAGSDARRLASELGKLAAYLGERAQIEVEDVLALVPQEAGEDFFAVGRAVEARDGKALVAAIEAELALGSAELRILGGLVSAARGLLATRALLDGLGVPRGIGAREFEARVFPKLAEADKRAGRKPQHPFRAYKRAEAAWRYEPQELARALIGLAQADIGIKTGMDASAWLVRAAVALTGG